MGNLITLRSRKAKPLTAEEYRLADELFIEYCNRPQHKHRLNRFLIAALRAAANRVARHGLPPSYSQRLGYHAWKKRRKRAIAIAIYGDPSEPSTEVLINRANRQNP